MSESLLQAFWGVLGNPQILLIIVAAAVYGIFMGAVPGLTATMAVALLVPVTFFLDPISALAAVVTVEACAIFAGDIPNVLLRIPGTPASAAYADDAYALTRAGRSAEVLGVSLTFSVAGGLMGTVILALFAPQLASITTWFTVAEYFWLYLIGLSCAVIVSRGSMLKAAFALIVGLLLSTVGLSAVHTQARFTFGQAELFQGINFIPAMIGLFGVSEVFRNILSYDAAPHSSGRLDGAPVPPRSAGRWLADSVHSVFGASLPFLWLRKWHAIRSAVIGSLIGMLPGAGADIAAWVSLAVSKRFSRKPEEYGAGSMEGISDASSANNSALAGAWVPALVFGIPGDSVTAIVMGVLLMKNIKPGPEIFEKQAVLVYSIFLIFLLANLVLIGVGFLAVKAGGYVVRIPRRILLPVILLFCVIGSYAINGSYFDIGVMLVMGGFGFALERRQIPLGPVVLGIILGGPLEERFIQTLSSSASAWEAFFSRPMAATLGITAILVWLAPVAVSLLSGRRPLDRGK